MRNPDASHIQNVHARNNAHDPTGHVAGVHARNDGLVPRPTSGPWVNKGYGLPPGRGRDWLMREQSEIDWNEGKLYVNPILGVQDEAQGRKARKSR